MSGPGDKTVQISPDAAAQIARAEASIQQWSVRYMDLALEMRGLESTVHTLRGHRDDLLQKALKEAGVDVGQFSSAYVSADGNVHLSAGDPPSAP